jgi:hypothetical protein
VLVGKECQRAYPWSDASEGCVLGWFAGGKELAFWFPATGEYLLTDSAARRHHDAEPRFVTVAGCGGVLNQADVIGQDVLRHSARRISVARVLIVHSEGDPRVDRDIREGDLIPVRRD